MRSTVVLLVVLGCTLARARPAHASDPVAAEALFREGRRAIEAGDYPLACAKFEESDRLDPAPGTLLNLADCEERRGRLARAWQRFRQLYDVLPESDDRRQLADSRARALEGRMPRLRVVVRSSEPVTVTRDETLLGPASLGDSQPVDPGRHVIVVSAPARRDQRYEVELREGETKEVDVSPGDRLTLGLDPVLTPPAPPPADRATLQEASGARRTEAWVLGGVGAASLLTGAAFGVAALSRLSASNAQCSGDVCTSQGAIDQFRLAQSFALVADLTGGIGLVCLGTAVVLAVTGHRPSTSAATLPAWAYGQF